MASCCGGELARRRLEDRAQARRAHQVSAAEPDGGVGQQTLEGRRQHLAEGRRLVKPRQRAAFNGRDTERFSRIAAATAQGAFAARWTVQGFSRHSTTPSKQSGR